MGGFQSLAFGGRLYLVCAVCDVIIWCHIHVSKPTLSRNLLTQYVYSFIRTPLIICVIVLNINYQRSRLRYRRNISSTLRHSSSWLRKYQALRLALKQGSKTHSSLRQSNLQLQNQAALMSCRNEQWSTRNVRLDFLTHTPVCKIESC